MLPILATQLTLSPGSHVATIASVTGLHSGQTYTAVANYLTANTTFTFHGSNQIVLTKPPVEIPTEGVSVLAEIGLTGIPPIYPYSPDDRLHAGNLNNDFESSAGPLPPSGSAGGAGPFKFWMDTTSAVTPQLRMSVTQATPGSYVVSEWALLATIDVGAHAFDLTPDNIHAAQDIHAGNSIYADGGDLFAGAGNLFFSTTPAPPLIGADQQNMVFTLGPLAGSFYFNKQPSGVAAQIDNNGNILASGNVTTEGGLAFVDTDGSHTWTWHSAGDVARLTSSTYGDTLSVNGSNSTAAAGNFIALGNLSAGANIYNGGADGSGIYFTGTLGAVAPYLAVDTADFHYRLGPDNGSHYFEGTNGNILVQFRSDGLIYNNGRSFAVCDASGAGDNKIYDNGGNIALWLGTGSDNIYRSNNHHFQSVSGGADMLTIGSSGIATSGTVSGSTFIGQVVQGSSDNNAGALMLAASTSHVTFRWDTINLFYRIDNADVEERVLYGRGIQGITPTSDTGSPSGQSMAFFYSTTGSYLVNIDTISDGRFKADIRNTEINALEALCAVPVRAFEWNDKALERMPHVIKRAPIGLVAQEVKEAMPYVVGVNTDDDNLHKIIYEHLTPYLVRAIQQLAERVETLEGA